MIAQVQKETEALTVIKYFSLFRHPLKLEEIHRFTGGPGDEDRLRHDLEEMVASGMLRQKDGFYLYNGTEKDIEKRMTGEARAAVALPKAQKVGRFIALFPFVRFVGISGSLSKGYAGDNTDFDFFIITAHNTLWICRSILHLVKKLSFLAGRQHWMCMNYFLDEHALELEEKNLFTQIELSTLIPVNNPAMYRMLLLQNRENLPNFNRLPVQAADPEKEKKTEQYRQYYGKEKNRFWKPLNRLLMVLTDSKWRRKWRRKGYPMEDYSLAFKTTPYVSKNHPKNYQKTILNQLRAE